MKKLLLLCSTFIVCLNTNAQTAAGPQTVTAAANNTSTNTTSWNVTMNSTYIADIVSGNSLSKGLNLTGLAFNIPLTATIVGVMATTSYSGSTIGTPTAPVKDSVIRLLKGGTETGSNLGKTNTRFVSCGLQSLTYGSSSNMWGAALTPTDVNAASFGLVIYLFGSGTEYLINTYTVCSNAVKTSVTVYYTTSSGIIESQTNTAKLYSFGKNLYLNDFVNENSSLEVYNLIGEKVYATNIEKNQKLVDLSNLNTGVYIYKLKMGDKELCKKFAIE